MMTERGLLAACVLLMSISLCVAEPLQLPGGHLAICTVRQPLTPAAGEIGAYLLAHEPLVKSLGVYGVSMTTVLFQVPGVGAHTALTRLQEVGYCDSWTLIEREIPTNSLLVASAIQAESDKPTDLLTPLGSSTVSVGSDGIVTGAVSMLYASDELYVFFTSASVVAEFPALELRGAHAITSLCNGGCDMSEEEIHSAASALAWQEPVLQKALRRPSPLVDLRGLLREFLEERNGAAYDIAEDPIAERVALVSQDSLRSFLNTLTSVYTRLSDAGDVPLQASYFIKGFLQGLGLDPFFYYFKDGYVPDVCADITGALQPEVLVVIGAHMDDRMQNINDPTARAPGANDDGSGSAMLSELVRIFAETKTVFEYTVRFCWWAGEEQGLLGSTAYANELYANGTEVVGMLQGDMLAYRVPGAPTQVDMATRSTDYDLTMLVNQVTAHYVPEIRIGNTTSCCTDSASFYNVGYAAAAYNEAGGYTIDPEYHNTMDVVDRPGYNLPQLQQITQAMLAGAAVLGNIL